MKSVAAMIISLALCASLYVLSVSRVQAAPQIAVTTAKTVVHYNFLDLQGRVEDVSSLHISADGYARLKKVFVVSGEKVKKGQALAEYEPLSVPVPENIPLPDDVRAALEEIDRSSLPDEAAQAVSAILSAGAESLPALPGGSGESVTVYCPEDGMITSVTASEGDTLLSGAAFMTVSNMRRMQVRMPVPETAVSDLREGMRCNISGSSFSISGILPGKITKIMPVARQIPSLTGPSETVIDVLVDISISAGNVRPGSTADVRVFTSDKLFHCALPYSAVVQDEQNNEACFVIENGMVRKRKIVTGSDLESVVAVVSGLSAGETVVLSPDGAVRDGAPVRLSEVAHENG